jgi:tRNA A37 threonylcarbamoyltransferase TsaD
LQAEVKKLDGVALSFPSLKYCTDNAAMIAVAAYFKHRTENKRS